MVHCATGREQPPHPQQRQVGGSWASRVRGAERARSQVDGTSYERADGGVYPLPRGDPVRDWPAGRPTCHPPGPVTLSAAALLLLWASYGDPVRRFSMVDRTRGHHKGTRHP